MLYPLNPPLTEFLILSVIARGDSYGYEISQQLKAVSDLKDSALYPVLKRLAGNGYVRVYDQQYQGRNRKYYQMTETGAAYYRTLMQEWENYTTTITKIVKGEEVGYE